VNRPVARRRERAVRAVLPIFAFAVLTVVVTYPLAFQATDHLRDNGDSYEYAWAVGFGAYQLTHDPLHLFDGNIFYPFPLSLAYSDSIVPNLILGTPLVLLTHNPILALNALLLLTFFLAGVGMYLLVRERTGSSAAGMVAGVVYAFNPYLLDHLAQIPNVSVQWAPFALWCFERYVATGRSRWAAGFVAASALQVLVSFYYAFILGIGILTYVGIRLIQLGPGRLRRSWILRLLGFALVGALAIVPFALPYFRVARELGLTRSASEVLTYSAWPANYLSPTPTLRVIFIQPVLDWITRHHPGWIAGANERHLYPGLATLVLALVGLVRGSRSSIIAAALCVVGGFVLSLGPQIHLTPDRALTLPVPTPYTLLYTFLPGFAALRVSARFAALVVFGLALLAGEGVARLRAIRPFGLSLTAWRAVLPAVAVALATAESAGAFPMTPVLTGADVPPVYRWLAAQPGPSPVVELPMDIDAFHESPRSYYSTYDHQPLVNGFRSFWPPGYVELIPKLNTFPSPIAIQTLRQIGARYVVVHRAELDAPPDPTPPSVGAQLVATFGADDVYAVDGAPTFPDLAISAFPSSCLGRPGDASQMSIALTSADGLPFLSFPVGTRSLVVRLSWKFSDGATWAESTTVSLAAPVLLAPTKLTVAYHAPPRPGPYRLTVSILEGTRMRGTQIIPDVAFEGPGADRPVGPIQLVSANLITDRPTVSGGLPYQLVWKTDSGTAGTRVARVDAYDDKGAYWSFPESDEQRVDPPRGCASLTILDASRVPLNPMIPPGRYSAEVVLVNPENDRRVPFVGPSGDTVDHVSIGSFWIRPIGAYGASEFAADAPPRANLGGQIDLLESTVHAVRLPGSTLRVDARWRAAAPMDRDYTVFVHVSDTSGRVIAQYDGQPTNATYPTSAWLPGETIVDHYTMTLPSPVPPGPLTVSLGVYDLRTLQRLPVIENGKATGDEIVLGTLR
jgi:hypothetical protein